MKAYVLHAPNDLRYQEVDIPQCRPGWVIVRVKAAGICSSDIPRIFVKGTYRFPTIPGHEFSGVVVRTASAEDQKWEGKRVGVFPLIPCRQCEQCGKKRYELCTHYDYIGSRRDGGFAEYVAVPAWNLVELPNAVSYEDAALMEPFAVALHAVKQANIRPGSSVAVVGSGMIGFAAAQWAMHMGAACVCVVGRSEAKRELAKKIPGLRFASNPGEEFDTVIEAVGTDESICSAIGLVKASGCLVLMGNPAGDIVLPQDIYWRILRKQLCAIGTWNSGYQCGADSDWTRVRDALASGQLITQPLITHRFPQEQLADGLDLMKKHLEPYCKVMTIWSDGE